MRGYPELRSREPTTERVAFEDFTAGADWRALPLKIRLMIVNLWRAERDVPPASPSAG
jgi:hypothetical protein